MREAPPPSPLFRDTAYKAQQVGDKKTTVAQAASSLWLTFSSASVTMAGGSQLTEDTATKSKVSQRISETRHNAELSQLSANRKKQREKKGLGLVGRIFLLEAAKPRKSFTVISGCLSSLDFSMVPGT